MGSIRDLGWVYSRRQMMWAAALAAAVPALSRYGEGAMRGDQARTSNGGTEPFPIPWLDKNGNHNQPAGPNLEPSHIFHFKGRVARCSTFTGQGTDNSGNRLSFGSPTTDYGLMRGEYFAGRRAMQGVFAHI